MNSGGSEMVGELRSRLKPTPGAGGGWQVTFDPDFAGFAGHFPGNPIVPGVCLLLLARVCAEQTVGAPLELAELQSCRFRRPVLAGDTVTCSVACSEADAPLVRVRADIAVESGSACQVRMLARRA